MTKKRPRVKSRKMWAARLSNGEPILIGKLKTSWSENLVMVLDYRDYLDLKRKAKRGK